jgi:hypothetical protein
MTDVDVRCESAAEGWTCVVRVSEGSSSTDHQVAVRTSDLATHAPGATEPDDLVRRSFEYLLSREPKESILRSFDLPVIARYFPDWPEAIRRGRA